MALALALALPKISSSQVEAAIRFRRQPHELDVLRRPRLLRHDDRLCCFDWPIWYDERVRITAASSGERPGQERGDPGAAPPDHGAGTAAGYDPAAVLPRRPGVPCHTAAPAPARRARTVPAADPARDSAALAPRPAGAPPRGQVPAQAPCGVPEVWLACELRLRLEGRWES